MALSVLFMDTTHPLLPEELTRMGYNCDYFTGLNREEYKRILNKYSGLIVRGKIKLDKELLDEAKNLRFIGRVGAGMEGIDLIEAKAKGIICLNAPEGNREAVAEHALGMLLSLCNRLKIADQEVRQGIWKRERNRGIEISGKTIAIIGYGNMGSAFAQRLQGFNARIIAYDKYKSNFGNDNVEECNMQQLFTEADIVSLHVPLTSETEYLVNSIFLNQFKKDIFLINTSRGKVVNTADLVQSLQQGKVKGAMLDVLEYEGLSFENLDSTTLPPPFKFLTESEKVILTPHIAGWTLESHRKLSEVLVIKIKELNLDN